MLRVLRCVTLNEKRTGKTIVRSQEYETITQARRAASVAEQKIERRPDWRSVIVRDSPSKGSTMSFAGLMGAPGDMYGSRALTASPGHRSKLAAIFGASERTTTPGHDGFVTSADGQAKLTPRAAIPGTYLQPHSPRDYGSAFDRTAASPRALAAAAANMRYGSPRSERSRAEHMQREAEIRQRAAEVRRNFHALQLRLEDFR